VDTVGADNAPSREEVVLELARRLLTPHHQRESLWRHRFQIETPPVQLLVGQLPPDFPAEIPIPADALVVGSLVGAQGMPRHTVVLDASGGPQDILRFYDERLTAQGWLPPPGRDAVGTERTAGRPNEPRAIRWFKTADGPSLLVSVLSRSTGGTDVELALDLDPRHCRMMWTPPIRPDEAVLSEDFLRLSPPPGSRVAHARRDMDSSSGAVHVSQILDTALDVPDLLDHYAEQLRAAGWKEGERADSAPIGITAWRLDDTAGDDWWVILTVMKDPWTADHRVLSLHAQRKGSESSASCIISSRSRDTQVAVPAPSSPPT